MKSNKKYKLKKIIFFVFIILCVTLFLGNKIITITQYDVISEKLPKSFNNYKIVQVSDLHNASFGKNNKVLLKKIKGEKPDIIVVTGDLVDSRHTDINIATKFLEEAVKIAPTYYVTGNHEFRIYEDYLKMEQDMIDIGVYVLRNNYEYISIGEETIQLVGVDASVKSSFGYYIPNSNDKLLQDILDNLVDEEKYSLLLAHRPELYNIYKKSKASLVLSGHTHGGQVRLPFLGGVVVPNQKGLFPKYDSGIFFEDVSTLIISRGLGNSLFPFRVFNQPEVVTINLKTK